MAFSTHLKALVVKNMRLYKRGGFCSCCEIIWSAVFILFLCLFRSVIDVKIDIFNEYLSINKDNLRPLIILPSS